VYELTGRGKKMAKEKQEIQKYDEPESGSQQMMTIPSEWGLAIPAEQFKTTIDVTTQAGRQLLYLALNEDGESCRDVVNRQLDVVGITFCPQIKVNDDGEVENKIATKLSLADGSVIGTNSEWVLRSLISLLHFKRTVPNIKSPWSLEIYSKATGKNEDGQPKTCLKVRDLSLARKKA
jgi:hypothetical protein